MENDQTFPQFRPQTHSACFLKVQESLFNFNQLTFLPFFSAFRINGAALV